MTTKANQRLPDGDLEEILARAEKLLVQLAEERMFVSGGTGFFGRWLLEALSHADRRLGLKLKITTLCRAPEAFLAANPHLATNESLRWWRGDVRDFSSPPGTFRFVIHAATPANEHFNRTQPASMFDTIIRGTRRMLDFAETSGTNALLLTSSGAVYGKQPAEISHINEDFRGGPDPTSPLSAYAEGKRAAEFLVASSNVPSKIARGFAFAGPLLPMNTHFAYGNFVRDAVLGNPIEIRGDGSPLRSYLYASDLVVWLLTILLHGAHGRPYNVGSDVTTSIHDLAQLISEEAGNSGIEVQQKRTLESGTPAERYVPSIDRARHELGLEVWTPLQESIRRTIAWARLADACTGL